MPTPATTALDKTDAHSMTALYRAAIGEVNSTYYLPLFERFEAADRAGLRWNGSAALYTLNWLAFRQLWHAALLYVGAWVALALGIFGIGRLLFDVSETTQWGLAAGLVLLSVLVPGLGGNAWLYQATRKRIEAALQVTHSIADACILLGRTAPRRKGLIVQMVANGLGIGLLAYGGMQFKDWVDSPPVAVITADGRNVAAGRTIDASTPVPVVSVPATVAAAPAVSPASAPLAAASAPLPAASSSATSPVPASVAAPEPAPVAALASSPATAAPATVPSQAPQQAQAAPAKASADASKKPRASQVPPAPATARAAAASPAKIMVLSQPIALDAATARVAGSTVGATASAANAPKVTRYIVNVGLFAQENNARNAYTQLADAELPATSQGVRTSQGTRTRVRVGPFETQVEAERAAEKIRALGLEAQVAPQP